MKDLKKVPNLIENALELEQRGVLLLLMVVAAIAREHTFHVEAAKKMI